jgi:hypothetical protein
MRHILISLPLSAVLALPAELPIKEVSLYKHGVAFFERSGTLAQGESARLDFNASDMNDVLKSLTIEERCGGKISGLRYDAMDPLSHKLSEFPFQVGGAESLSAMLDQLKGARLELKFGNETVSGAIVSSRMTGATDKQPEREQLTLLVDSGDLRNLDLSAASGIRFTDPQLQAQFKDYLAALSASRSKEKRSVYIDSVDSKAREIVASYMIPAPVWKSSYRLIFDPKAGTEQPVLEGWAIVDNTTGEDWTNVRLSLVSGRPISFISQLYAPRYVTRPVGELPEDRASAPVLHPGAYEAEADALAKKAPGVGGGAAGGVLGGMIGGVMGGVAGGVASPPPVLAAVPQRMRVEGNFQAGQQGGNQSAGQTEGQLVAPSSIISQALSQELGELFEYRIATPVTIRKDESAMLPFLQQKIESRKLLIYSQHGSEHPTNAAELTNTSGKTLDGGPITVYDDGAYGGEALMETLKAGDKRLISYAVDLGTRVTEAFDSKQEVVREIHANRGVLTAKMAAQETRTYTARNVDQKAKTLIIEYPLRPGYTLLNQKPMEKTPSSYRFEIQLAAGATQKFAVSEERVYDRSMTVTNLTPNVILTYVQNRDLSDAGRRQLQQMADRKSQLADTQAAIQDVENQIRDLTSDEDRVRRNIESLNQVSGQQQQVQNYARQLDANEQQLAGLRDRQAELQKQRTGLESEITKAIDALSF